MLESTNNHEKPLRIIQITDLHLLSEPGAQMFGGVDTYASLMRVLDKVRQTLWPPDAVVATGDLSDDGMPASYQRLQELLLSLEVPVHCIPGNHDAPDVMKQSLACDRISIGGTAEYGNWNLIFLDSCVPDEPHGNLAESELQRLSEALRSKPDKNALLFLHHGPIPVCSKFTCNLENPDDLLRISESHPNVRGVAWGHVHFNLDSEHQGVAMMGTPSTYTLFKHPKPAEDLDEREFLETHQGNPDRIGFRLIELHPDGNLSTEIIWV